MIFNLFFYLLFIFDSVISESIESAIPNNKSDNEIKKESLFNTIQEKNISLTFIDNEPSLNNPFIADLNSIKSETMSRDILEKHENTLITSDNYNTIANKSEILESSISERINDPLLKEIFNAIPKNMPTVLIDIMDDYIHYDDTIDEYLDRIKNKLLTVSEKAILDLYDPDFMSNLLELVRSNKKEIPLFHELWYDLERFLFKYALLMRRLFANDNASFEKSVKNIKDIMIIVNGKTRPFVDIDYLESMTNFDFSVFDFPIKYEIFDHLQLLELFTKKIIDSKANLLMTLDEIEQDYCNGNFNNNPFLMMMLIEFAFGDSANEQILKRGWVKSKDMYSRKDEDFATALHQIYLRDGKHGDEIEYLTEHYLSHSTIKFFIDNNLGFRIINSSHLVRFLKRLEHIGGLPKEVPSIDRIIKLYLEDQQIFKWDKATFVNYLIKEKGKYDPYGRKDISPEEYQKFMKLVE